MHVDAILISILKYCFIVELFEKWHSALPPIPSRTFQLGDSFGRLATQLGVSPCFKAPNPDATRGGGGGVAWVALWRAFPQTQRISFLPCSPNLHDFWPVFLMIFSPINTAHLLILF
jgi:hypothetical protein